MRTFALKNLQSSLVTGGFMTALLVGLSFGAPSALAVSDPLARPQSPAMPALLAHRAIYELRLASSSGNKAPNTAHGRIAFDFTGNSCEGYVQNFRQYTELQLPEGPARVSDLRAATFEDGEGKSFRFKLETRIDNGGVEDVDGKAAKSNDGALSVSLSRPKLSKVDLDRDVVFPTDHIRRIIDAARTGKTMLELKVYDGSDTGEKIFETLAVVGKPATAPVVDKLMQAPEMQNVSHWPVSVSYFEEGKKDSQPAYVLSFDLYENGVSRALRLDYGDFVLAGEMTKLEVLPAKECPGK